MIPHSGDTSLAVDSASNAMRGTLYDAAGRVVSGGVFPKLDTRPYSYMVGMINLAAFTADVPNYVFLNPSASRRIRIRQLLMEVSEFSSAAAVQHVIRVEKTRIAGTYFTVSAGTILSVAAYFSPVAKTFGAPPPIAQCLSVAAGFATATRADTTTLANIALPGSASYPRTTFEILTDIEEPSAAITLESMEALVWIPVTATPTNAFSLHVEWDEEIITT